ncbi:MAG: pilus assembly protein PilM [Deltaproteobacteria bacterium]|nr:pilus assembly protein PilM [Deltaproteobacteria bacterium]
MVKLKPIYPIGIDFDNQDLYAVQLKRMGEGVAIREMVHQRLSHPLADTMDSGDSLASILREILKKNHFRGKRILFNIPYQYVYTFPISFEIGNGKSIEDAIVQEMKGYLSFTVNEAIIDYPSIKAVTNGETTKYKAIIVVVQRDKMGQYLNVLKQAGLSVEAVDVGLTSLIRLHRNLFELSEKPVILCNVGHRESTLCIVTEDSILANRNVNWGLQPLLNSLKNNLELPDNNDQALSLLRNYGLLYEDHADHQNDVLSEGSTDNGQDRALYRVIFQVLSPYIDDLINEFHQIIGYVRAETHEIAFNEIFMYGQANSLLHLDKHLERRLNIPTRCVNPMTNGILCGDGILSDRAEEASFSLALGLAMRKGTWL